MSDNCHRKDFFSIFGGQENGGLVLGGGGMVRLWLIRRRKIANIVIIY